MTYKRKRRHAIKLPHYQVAAVKPLGHNHEIEAHLRNNGIWQQAQDQLKEIYYYVQDENGRRKDFFAAGWLNELGHWQVAAPNYTGCLGHPALTIFRAPRTAPGFLKPALTTCVIRTYARPKPTSSS